MLEALWTISMTTVSQAMLAGSELEGLVEFLAVKFANMKPGPEGVLMDALQM